MLGYGYYSGNQLLESLDNLVLNYAKDSLKQEVRLSAQVEAGNINLVFNEAMEVSKTLAASFTHQDPNISRDSVIQMMGNTIDNIPNIIGIYSGWEYNKFDNLDEQYVNTEYVQKNGEFAPYFNRSPSGNIILEASYPFYDIKKNENGIRGSEWYLCPKETLSACVIDPASYVVQGKSTLMSSFTAPVLRNGEFAGMFGVDYSLDFLQTLAVNTSNNLLEGQSRVLIISASGIIAADSGDDGNIGKMLGSTEVSQLIRERQHGEVVLSGESIIANESFTTVGTNKPWHVVVVVPEKVALAGAYGIVETLSAHFNASQTGQMTVGLITGLLGMGMIWLVAASISAPITVLVKRVEALTRSGGDLTQQIEIARRDETGQLANHLNTFIHDVRGIVGDVAGSVQSLTSSVAATSDIAKESQTQIALQSDEIDQVVAATTEMASTAHSVSDNAQETASAVSLTQQSVEQGHQVVAASAEGLRELAGNVEGAAKVIEILEQETNNIGSILEVIRNISEQTNLLALNAAIEAARAGEQGRGFAVVADEVRNLATKTAQSTDEIQQMIDSLRHSSKDAVEKMRHNRSLSDVCLEHAQQAVCSLEEVRTHSGKIQDMAHQIASAAEEQAAVTEEVNRSLVAINEVAGKIGTGANQTLIESERVCGFTQDVSKKINFFRY
ncbi:methyl-accepting chemotaxis protein [Photobacterium sp. MCCC 1A19761]|uniref:methyl-accepting chemotaxis protein n=1 Tax=Photobacterium sp. MCCC 1A19761 TaxID=3115000 RepID=UPI00307F9724